jgi:hypothetical protein
VSRIHFCSQKSMASFAKAAQLRWPLPEPYKPRWSPDSAQQARQKHYFGLYSQN